MIYDPRPALAHRVYYGWIIVIACFLASVVVFGTTYAFGVFYDVLVKAFDSSETLIAVVFGVQTALIYVSSVAVSRLIQRHGQRYVAAASSTVLVTGLIWTSMARSYLELLAAFGIVSAVGMGGLYNVSYATLPAWFDRRRGTATGLASAGLGVGLIVVPPGTDAVISVFGWRAAVLTLVAFIAFLSIVIVALFADDPAEVGADPTAEFGEEPTLSGDDEDGDVRAIVTSSPFLIVFAGWTMVFAPMYVVFGHIVRYAAEAGIGRSIGVLSVAVIGTTTTAARIGIGPISDRLGRPRTFVTSSVLLGGSTVGLAVASTTEFFLGAVALFGIGYAGSGGLIGAITADLFGRQSLSTLFAVLSMSFAIAGLSAPPLAGAWFEVAGDYRLAFLMFGAVGVAGAGCVFLGTQMSYSD